MPFLPATLEPGHDGVESSMRLVGGLAITFDWHMAYERWQTDLVDGTRKATDVQK